MVVLQKYTDNVIFRFDECCGWGPYYSILGKRWRLFRKPIPFYLEFAKKMGFGVLVCLLEIFLCSNLEKGVIVRTNLLFHILNVETTFKGDSSIKGDWPKLYWWWVAVLS
eukprot:TRINITY_DN107412_c0_g1_i1.p1 TRINITY_DN107412_c0_g1~~TRINITY_DN107412_c0_g1_i1.p1  ORF type:complete len:110 (-),score=8.23 TRINITY_DN107412_c0_g1_i1:68-397(-)